MKLKRIIIFSCLFVILMTASAFPVILSENYKTDINGRYYIDRNIPVYGKSDVSNKKVKCRFYADMPYVPYVDIETFYSYFYAAKMDVTQTGSHKYEFRTEKASAVFDGFTNSLSSDNMSLFCANPKFESGDDSIAIVTSSPFLKLASVSADKCSPKEYSYSKYGIQIKDDGEKVYFPIATLSDMFACPEGQVPFTAGQVVYYNGSKLFYSDGMSWLDTSSTRNRSQEFIPWIADEKRPADMAKFSYSELCFCVENLYGFPLCEHEFSDKIKSDGLDAALREMYPELAEALCSELPEEYLSGVAVLFARCLNDGGHTGVYMRDILETEGGYDLYMDKIQARIRELTPDEYKNLKRNDYKHSTAELCTQAKTEVMSESPYNVVGDTAVISFNDFSVDYAAWKSFYEGNSKLPDEVDTVSLVYKYLKKAAVDKKIKNVVLDLTSNMGGDLEAVNAVLELVTDGEEVRVRDEIGSQNISLKYQFDRNFDGKFDSRDNDISFKGLRFAVLTSNASFSAANALTAYLHDNGIVIIGEPTGGGACGIADKCTADGFAYLISSNLMLSDHNTDDGISPDILLEAESKNGVKDYSGFFDIDNLSRIIEDYYSDKDN